MTDEVDRSQAFDPDEGGAGRIPPRFPLACGALGRYETDRVGAVAEALGCEMATVHQDAHSTLLLDRPALPWNGEAARGFAWSEAVVRPGPVACWEDAACRWAACGLVVEEHRRYLHSSVAGVAPLYYLRFGAAIYFASRIDALVRAIPSPLSVDWEAWSAIFFLGHAVGDRTTFTEVRRLDPFSTLEAGADGAPHVRAERWPWAEAEPTLAAAEAVDAVVDRARSAVRALPAERIICPLSGGWDSRLLLCLLQEERPTRVAGAYTLPSARDHAGEDHLAAAVAAALGVAHTVVEPQQHRYPSDFARSAHRTDYLRNSRPVFMPLVDRLRSETGLIVHGFGLDMLLDRGGVWQDAERLSAEAGIAHLWHELTQPAEAVLSPPLARAMAASARVQLQAEVDQFRGHPAYVFLTLHRTRIVRRVAMMPASLLGHDLSVGIPFADHELTMAGLSVRPSEKLGGRLFRAVFERVNPAVGELPSTNDGTPPAPPPMPSRATSPPARRMLAWTALHGPFTPYLATGARERLTDPEWPSLPGGGMGRHFLEMVALFTLWHQRYRDRLGDVEPPTDIAD